jgi:hypothetical protein
MRIHRENIAMKNIKIMLIAVAGAAAMTLTPVMITSASAATTPPVCTVMGPNAPDCVTTAGESQVHGSTGYGRPPCM